MICSPHTAGEHLAGPACRRFAAVLYVCWRVCWTPWGGAQGLQASAVFQRIPQARWARPALGALGLLLAGTLLLSLVRGVGRFNSPKAKRRRTVDLNKVPCSRLHGSFYPAGPEKCG